MRKVFKNLTPKTAWDKYGVEITDRPIEHFLSNFIAEGCVDITEMCQKFAIDAVHNEDILATTKEINHVAKLIEQYIREYVEKKGGISKIELYTDEELEKIWDLECEDTLNLINKFKK